jgi:hypothetical protein
MAILKSLNIDGDLPLKKGTTTHPNSSSVAVDLATGNYFEVDLQNSSGDISTFTITEALSGTQAQPFVLKITQGSPVRHFNWSAINNVKWPKDQDISWQNSQSAVSVTAHSSSGSGTGYTCTITTNTSDNTNLTNVNTSAGSGSGYVFGEKIFLKDPGNTNNYAVVTVTQVNGSGGVNNINETSYSALAVTYAGSTTNNAVDIYSFIAYDAGINDTGSGHHGTWHAEIVGQNFT